MVLSPVGHIGLRSVNFLWLESHAAQSVIPLTNLAVGSVRDGIRASHENGNERATTNETMVSW